MLIGKLCSIPADSGEINRLRRYFFAAFLFLSSSPFKLCASEFGEIEMHLHHNRLKPFPDTTETLIWDSIANFLLSRYIYTKNKN